MNAWIVFLRSRDPSSEPLPCERYDPVSRAEDVRRKLAGRTRLAGCRAHRLGRLGLRPVRVWASVLVPGTQRVPARGQ